MKNFNLIITYFFILLTYNSSAQWEWQNPLPQGNTLYGIHFVDANNGWAAGGRTIIRTNDGGISWQLQESGIESSSRSISKIYFTDLMNGWAVGGPSPLLLQTKDGGSTWFQPGLENKLPGSFTDICFVDNLTGWIVGWSAVYQDEIVILHTIDAGDNWELQNHNSSGSIIDISVCFIDHQHGWIANGNKILHTSDGGENWTQQECNSNEDLRDIYFIDTDHGWAVGENGTVLITTNGGALWEPSIEPSLSGINSYEVNFIDAENGWLCGNYYDGTVNGAILKTADGGLSWEMQLINQEVNPMYCLSKMNGLSGFATGAHGEMLKTTNGGNSWEMISTSVTTCDFRDVFFSDDDIGWAAGGINTNDVITPAIYHTIDAGINWMEQELPLLENAYVFKLFFIDNQHGWAMGRDDNTTQLISTTDGGENWLLQSAEDIGGDLIFINSEIGWRIGSNGIIQKTEDGGWSWYGQISGTVRNLSSIIFLNEYIGWIAGDSIILNTSDGGETWMEQSSGDIFAWDDICFLDSQNGWVSGLLYGLYGSSFGKLMKTTDGGNVWEEIEIDVGGFSKISFTDLNKGWGQSATGTGGGASSPPLNNIWSTNDGGMTWELQSLPTLIYGGFYFTDENHGWAVSNYGTILHYNNEGSSGIFSYENSNQKLELINYPNPFSSTTTIEFSLANSEFVCLSVHDISGKFQKSIISKKLIKGNHQIEWNENGLPAGIYFLRLETNGISKTRKLILMD